jgi:hypothetical protein
MARIDPRRMLKRAQRAPCQSDRRQRIHRLRLKRQVNAQPEVALYACWRSTRGLLANVSASRVKLPGICFPVGLLAQKKESAARAPHDLEIICRQGGCAFQQLYGGANILYPLGLFRKASAP